MSASLVLGEENQRRAVPCPCPMTPCTSLLSPSLRIAAFLVRVRPSPPHTLLIPSLLLLTVPMVKSCLILYSLFFS